MRFYLKYVKVVFLVFVSICVATGVFFVVKPFFTHADSGYMSAVVVDDNGEVDFSPGISNAVANFKYIKTSSNAFDSKNYSVKISLTNLPSGDDLDRAVDISLPVGMVWVDDASGDKNLTALLDNTKGSNGVESVALDIEPAHGYTFSDSGSRVYHIAPGVSSLAINIIVKADKAICLGFIENAITAKLMIDGNSESEASVDVNVPSGISAGGTYYKSTYSLYITRGINYQTNEGYYRRVEFGYVAGRFATSRLINSFTTDISVNNPKAKIKLSTSDSRYSLTDNGDGTYVFRYVPTRYSATTLNIPYYIYFEDDMNVGESAKITFSNGKVAYWSPDGNDVVVDFTNTSTITATALGDEPDVAIGFSTLKPTATRAFDKTEYIAVSELPEEIGQLGFTYISNRGTTTSNSQIARIKIDANKLGAMAFNLPCEPSGTIASIHLKMKSGIEKDAVLSKSCSRYGAGNFVSYVDLGLSRAEVLSDPISELEYELGAIPGATILSPNNTDRVSFAFFGKHFDANEDAIATLELFDVDDPTNTTGESKIIIKYDDDQRLGAVDVIADSTKAVEAGETLRFKTKLNTWATGSEDVSYLNSTPYPIIYIRSEIKNAAGEYLPITNIKITNGEARGNEDITRKFGAIDCYNTPTAYVCKADGRNATDGSASITFGYVGNDGIVKSSSLEVEYSINTDLSTPDQRYDIDNMVFVQDNGLPISRSYSHTGRGDPFGVTDGNETTFYATSGNYYYVRGWSSIGVENSGKHINSEKWTTWDNGSSPIMIGSEEGSLADMRTVLSNNSGVEVSGPTTAYLPIPKKGQNWGTLSYDAKTFEFSMALDDVIDNPNSSIFTVAYGKGIAPSDNGQDLESQDANFYTNTSGWTESDWNDVNCVRIVARNIPANESGVVDKYSFIYRLKVVDAISAADDAVNTWRPIYYQALTNSNGDVFAGWYKGSYASVALAVGKISGEVFVDANENGKKDAGEQSLNESGWEIKIYDKNTNTLIYSTETNTSGKYSFVDLAMNDDGYYMTVENKHTIDSAGVTYLFTPKGNESNSGRYNTDNQAEGNTRTNPIHSTAYIYPVSPSQTAGEAVYNIGVVEYAATEEYQGEVVFDDYDNQYNTRPENILITIISSDGSEYEVNINTEDSLTWKMDLPKYSDSGERLTYTFSTPEIDDYSIVGNWNGTNKYDFTFTLTRTIVVPSDDEPAVPKTEDGISKYILAIPLMLVGGVTVLLWKRR